VLRLQLFCTAGRSGALEDTTCKLPIHYRNGPIGINLEDGRTRSHGIKTRNIGEMIARCRFELGGIARQVAAHQ
jgi:hypothetical protein